MKLIFLPNYGEGKVPTYLSVPSLKFLWHSSPSFSILPLTLFWYLCWIFITCFCLSLIFSTINFLHRLSNDHLHIRVFRDVMLLGELLPMCWGIRVSSSSEIKMKTLWFFEALQPLTQWDRIISQKTWILGSPNVGPSKLVMFSYFVV